MPTTFYLAEGQSSQRDMLLSLQQLKPHYDIQIIAPPCSPRDFKLC